MDAGRKAAPAGRERLLDAAEELFATRGYDGASMRAITRRAGVELGLANYHFGTKDELFRQVVLRRAPAMSDGLERALAHALSENTLAAVYTAFARTHLDRLLDEEPGWRHYMRLSADIALKGHQGRLTPAVSNAYQPVLAHFVDAIARYRSDIGRSEAQRAFHVFHMAVLSILIHASPETSKDDRIGLGEIDALVATMVRIFASGT